jgi:HSP20 family protein
MVTVTSEQKPPSSSTNPPNKFLEAIYSKGYFGFLPGENWSPSVNLYETETAYLVCVDLAGVDKEKIDIEVHEGHLHLRGKRLVPSPTDRAVSEAQSGRLRIHLMEIDHGAFHRDVELPDDVHHDRITAKYINGMLWIDLPKKNN